VQEVKVHKALKVQQVLTERMALRVHKDPKALRVRTQRLPVLKEHKALKEHKVLRDQLAALVWLQCQPEQLFLGLQILLLPGGLSVMAHLTVQQTQTTLTCMSS
jgi:hypothetical protein